MTDHAQNSETDDRQQQLAQLACRALDAAFGQGFDLWKKDDSWKLVASVDDKPAGAADGRASDGLVRLLDESSADHGEPRVHEQTDGSLLLAIPVRRLGQVEMVGTSRFQTGTVELIQKMARLFLREFSQRQQIQRHQEDLEAHYAQISDDFEELTFLRTMTEHMELSQVSNDLVQMAHSALPLLRQSVKAESVAMVLAESGGPGDGEVTISALVDDDSQIVWVGLDDMDQHVCRELVREFGAAVAQQPVVKNRYDETEEGLRFPGVRDFVLVPIAKGDHQMGWLLALNRIYRRGIDGVGLRSHLSQFEFGTGEAGLMSSAASMLGTQAHNVELFREKEKLLINVVRAMVSAIEAKDPYTCGHSERVALYAKRLGEEIGLDEEHCERLYLTGLLHDVGKIGIRDATLGKPSRLTDEEFDEIKQHTELGWAILHDLDQLGYVLPGVVHHHERVDGKGYPDGLVGGEIPLEGRILAVADTYDAMTSDRPYRKGMAQQKAEEILRGGAGTQWDDGIVAMFLEIAGDILNIRQAYTRPEQPVRKPDDSAPTIAPAIATPATSDRPAPSQS